MPNPDRRWSTGLHPQDLDPTNLASGSDKVRAVQEYQDNKRRDQEAQVASAVEALARSVPIPKPIYVDRRKRIINGEEVFGGPTGLVDDATNSNVDTW